MKRISAKKLDLKRETLAPLQSTQLDAVNGGLITDHTRNCLTGLRTCEPPGKTQLLCMPDTKNSLPLTATSR